MESTADDKAWQNIMAPAHRTRQRLSHGESNGRVQVDKAASLPRRANKHWLLLTDPTNHIQSLGKHA